MCSFITQHNATDDASFEGVCNWHADCRNVHQSCCPWIECSFLYHKPSPKVFQRIWQYINRPHNRRPRVTTPAQDLHIQHLHLQDRLRPATRTAAATIGLYNQRISAQTVGNHLRVTHLQARRPHLGLDLIAVRRRNRLEWSNAHIWWCLALWRGVLFTDESWFSLYRADGRKRVSGLLMSALWIEWPIVAVGLWYGQAYVMDNEHRCILLMAFWMHRETVTRSWGPLLCHSSTTITSCCSMIMHGPMLQGSVHNSWKLKTSQFLHGQYKKARLERSNDGSRSAGEGLCVLQSFLFTTQQEH